MMGDFSICMKCGSSPAESEPQCVECRRRQDEYIAHLEAIVAKLPRTADGVPVAPGMRIYPKHPLPGLADDYGIVTIGIYDPETMEHHVHGYDGLRVGLNYSTHEAAEAAKETVNG